MGEENKKFTLKSDIMVGKINKFIESKISIILSIIIGISIGSIAGKDKYIIPKEFNNIEQIENELDKEIIYQRDNKEMYLDFLNSPEGIEYKKDNGGFFNE